MSELGDKQELFSELIANLITWAYGHGYKIRCGDFYAHDGHKQNSNHYIKLAADLNLFWGGAYLTKTEDHNPLGEYWESLPDDCRWGGRFDDGNHYSIIYKGRI